MGKKIEKLFFPFLWRIFRFLYDEWYWKTFETYQGDILKNPLPKDEGDDKRT